MHYWGALSVGNTNSWCVCDPLRRDPVGGCTIRNGTLILPGALWSALGRALLRSGTLIPAALWVGALLIRDPGGALFCALVQK